VLGIVFGVVMSASLVAWVADAVHISFARAFGLLVLVLIVITAAAKARNSASLALQRRLPCRHGVRGGLQGSCSACRAEAARAAAEKKEAEARWQKKQELKAAALRLQTEERRRLTNAWLTNAAPYFSMSPQEFETAIVEVFRALGYDVFQTPFFQ
jgi:signal transduction histidine kinase